jgi:hypothetical protein
LRRFRLECLRVACIAYFCVLWAGVIPTEILPPNPRLTAIRDQARSALASIGITAGLPIFTGSPTEWKIAANCLRVMGDTAQGQRLRLYANECPNRAGFRLRNPPFDQTLQQITRKNVERPVPADSVAADGLREVSDYFCHSSLVERPPLERVILEQTVYLRSAWSGDTFRNPRIWCAMSCAIAIPGAPVAPRCELRGAVKQVGERADVK